MIEVLVACGVLLWLVALVMVVAWLVGLLSGGRRMSWKRLLAAVVLLGGFGWILLLWASEISASC
jgi:hypothetical protein